MKFYFEGKPDAHLPPARGRTVGSEIAKLARSFDPKLRLETVTEHHVRRVMKMCHGNKAHAAAVLGVNRRTLQRYETRARRVQAGYNARQEATTMAAKKKTVAGKTSAKPTKKKAAPHGRKLDGTPKKKPGKTAAK